MFYMSLCFNYFFIYFIFFYIIIIVHYNKLIRTPTGGQWIHPPMSNCIVMLHLALNGFTVATVSTLRADLAASQFSAVAFFHLFIRISFIGKLCVHIHCSAKFHQSLSYMRTTKLNKKGKYVHVNVGKWMFQCYRVIDWINCSSEWCCVEINCCYLCTM